MVASWKFVLSSDFEKNCTSEFHSSTNIKNNVGNIPHVTTGRNTLTLTDPSSVYHLYRYNMDDRGIIFDRNCIQLMLFFCKNITTKIHRTVSVMPQNVPIIRFLLFQKKSVSILYYSIVVHAFFFWQVVQNPYAPSSHFLIVLCHWSDWLIEPLKTNRSHP